MFDPDPAVVADYDQLDARVRELFPDKSPRWRGQWIRRAYWYLSHDGDMTGAPPSPDGA